MFYRAVIQAVLLFGSKTCVILAGMQWKVEGAPTGFLWKITGKRALRLTDGTWDTPRDESVSESTGT